MKVFVFGVILSCLFIIEAASGQSALDGFDPNANDTIRAFAVQPDGKILIVGEFTVVKGVTRNRIARLNPDGTLDTSFDPNANHFVFAVALQSDGKILVGGLFTSVSPNGGPAVTRNRIARFNPDGTLDTTFDPNIDSSVFSFLFSIVVQADNKILIAGQFSSVAPNGGPAVTRNNIARFNADGTLDAGFDPNVSDEIYSIAVQANGKILIVGNFSAVSPNGGPGFIRFKIARLNADGTVDTTFSSGANQVVYTVAVQADGKILVGGLFTGVTPNGGASVTRNRIARFNADGTLDTAFNPNANNTVISIVVQPNGKILAGGNFTGFSPNGGGAVTRNNIARINSDGTLDTAFNPNLNGQVDSMAMQEDGKILVGGIFTTVGGQTRNRIARLERNGLLDQTINPNASNVAKAIVLQTDGRILVGGDFTTISGAARNRIARLNADATLDTTFNPNANGSVRAIALQPDGKILIAGEFTNVGGTSRNRIARLNADGTLDTGFNPNVNDYIISIATQTDGKIVIGGTFTAINGTTRNYIARLNADGTLDAGFDPNANSFVHTLTVQSDGKILLGGSFFIIGGTSRVCIARLNADGTLDTAFDPNMDGAVYSLAVQSDGKILIGGSFFNVGGTPRDRIARLNADGTLDAGFTSSASNVIYSIVVQSDGRVFAGGAFTVIGGTTRNHIARLNADGTTDANFNPNSSGTVFSIAVQPDGKVLVSGTFNTIGGATRSNIARLSNDTAALQNLVVTQAAVHWTLGGSSPQMSRVVFEQSTDGVTYTPLGNGTGNLAPFLKSKGDESIFAPTVASWTLTGLNLPTGQNIYIRARGYYRGGYFNGSESITETVKNAFLIGPTAASVSVSGVVSSSKGAGISKAIVTLIDSRGQMRTALSNSFGFYRFDDIAVGETYVFYVSSKRYQFTPRVLTVNEEITDLNFSAAP